MLTRTCCCGGCFEIDECPLSYGGLGDFTYTTNIDTQEILGTFASVVITSINANLALDSQACYTSAIARASCCFTGPECTFATDIFEEKYFDVMGLGSVDVQRTRYPCFTAIRRPDFLPQILKRIRCSQPKTLSYKNCENTFPISCSDVYPECYQGPISNYLTTLANFESYYALRLDNSAPCGEVAYEFDDTYEFDALIKGGGALRIRRNSQNTFTVDQTSGTGLSGLFYFHRANTCPGGLQTDCGPCTQGGNGGLPCASGTCCCRSVLRVSISLQRPYRQKSWVWSSGANDFVAQFGSTLNETQTLSLIYQGPVDERLYRVVGTSAQRTFTLVSGTITGTFNFNAPLGIQITPLNYCPNDLFGLPGDFSGASTMNTVVNDSLVTDECLPCQDNTPPNPDVLSDIQLSGLGVPRTIIVSRVTP